MARSCGATILSPKKGTLARFHRVWDIIISRWLPYVKLPHFDLPKEHNTLLVVAIGPGVIAMLDTIRRWRERVDTVAAFAIDVHQPGIDSLATPKLRKVTVRLDHIFFSYGQSLQKAQEISQALVSLLLQGADALKHGGHGGDRSIDIISFDVGMLTCTKNFSKHSTSRSRRASTCTRRSSCSTTQPARIIARTGLCSFSSFIGRES